MQPRPGALGPPPATRSAGLVPPAPASVTQRPAAAPSPRRRRPPACTAPSRRGPGDPARPRPGNSAKVSNRDGACVARAGDSLPRGVPSASLTPKDAGPRRRAPPAPDVPPTSRTPIQSPSRTPTPPARLRMRFLSVQEARRGLERRCPQVTRLHTHTHTHPCKALSPAVGRRWRCGALADEPPRVSPRRRSGCPQESWWGPGSATLRGARGPPLAAARAAKSKQEPAAHKAPTHSPGAPLRVASGLTSSELI